MAAAADKNLRLSRELTQTNSPAKRNADEILAEMSVSVDDLTRASRDIYGKPQNASSLSGRK